MFNNYTHTPKRKPRKFSALPCSEFQPGLGRTVREVMSDFVRGIRPNELPIDSPFTTPEQAEQLIQLQGRQLTRLEAARQLLEDQPRIDRLIADYESEMQKKNVSPDLTPRPEE